MEQVRVICNSSFFTSARHTEEDCIRHLHPALEIVLVTEGVLFMEIGGREYRILPDHAVFIPPFCTHLFRSTPGNRYHVLEFSGELVPYFFRYIGAHEPASHLFAVSRESAALTSRLPDSTEGEDYIAIQGVLAPLCHEIKEKCGFYSASPRNDDICRSAITYMCEHYGETLTLSDVARVIGVHPVTLSRLLSHLGVPFYSYLRYLRCSHALAMIRSTSETLTEIAYRSGFGSIRSFNRAFLAVYGRCPGDYRD